MINPTLDVGDVFKRTFDSWKAMAWPVTGLTAVMVLPFALLNLFLRPSTGELSNPDEAANFAVQMVLFLGLLLVQVIVQQFYIAAVCKAVVDVQDGRLTATLPQLLESVRANLVGELFATVILMGLGIGFGVLLCIVPGVYLAVIWAVAVPVVVLERMSAMDGLKRSRALVGESWPQVLVVLLLLFILNIALCDAGPLASLVNMPLSAIATTQMYLALTGAAGAPAQPVPHAPAFVEVGNEPDGAFWRGDRADFTAAYNLVVDGVRAAAASSGKTVQVGGADFTESILDAFSKSGNVANGFIAGVTAARLDFFSAHHYDSCSAATLSGAATRLKDFRAQLTAQEAASVPLHLTEWNIGLGNTCDAADFASAQSQSFASGFLTLMQDDSIRTARSVRAGPARVR